MEGIRRSLFLFHTRLWSEELRLGQNVILVQKEATLRSYSAGFGHQKMWTSFFFFKWTKSLIYLE